MLVTHPSELKLHEIGQMSNKSLVEHLLSFNDYCPIPFNRNDLAAKSAGELRGLLYAARRYYHSKGY